MDRRSFIATTAALAVGTPMVARTHEPWRQPVRPRPTAAQLQWQRDELAMFLHFGVNTFTDREWGDGTEDPAIFNPAQLDARQWARIARTTGFRAMVLTAKHHDGFCLWPTATTNHSVKASPFRGGSGDVVREFVEACRAEGLRVGLYCSPWDRNHPTYGDSDRYNAVFHQQLTELLTQYGPIHEVWFDGANGEGPNGKKQVYDWPANFGLVKRLQPSAVIFSDAGPDVRWCGNEKGMAGEPNWSTVDPALVPYPGADGPRIIAALQHGDRDGSVWRPSEADTSIRPGWFYHPAQDGDVRSVENLVELYFNSVGRNSKLLLNVPPTRAGLIHDVDFARLAGMRSRLNALFATDATAASPVESDIRGRRASSSVRLLNPARIGVVRLSEDIEQGQMVARYELAGLVDGTWRPLTAGTTIGHAKLDRFPAVTVSALRVTVTDAADTPGPIGISAYAAPGESAG
ncbi:MAG TPA: alpha-L-fucosidase [Gemmatimonadaceae bacterium]|nr:alpha-L-fucosidase [Gemmatimonadaceae bacterium]